MIYCNLSVLLAERNLKITKVSLETGISRTTLTSLALNHWQGVRADTLNALCKYLGVSVGDILRYYPFDIEFYNCKYDAGTNTAYIYFKCGLDGYGSLCQCWAYVGIDKNKRDTIYVDVRENNTTSEDVGRWDNEMLESIFKRLPVPVIDDLKREIINALVPEICKKEEEESKHRKTCKFPFEISAERVTLSLPVQWRKEYGNGNG